MCFRTYLEPDFNLGNSGKNVFIADETDQFLSKNESTNTSFYKRKSTKERKRLSRCVSQDKAYTTFYSNLHTISPIIVYIFPSNHPFNIDALSY